ncbi:hypothetical protein NPIL_378571 [Nephila pilipes]|uniref:Uncharacterized protein n=1 Tax=Nephila pilipes TaxID=299642 RepID=A0A8X6NJD4_NEPPI|nr:hypothetical protein NPIL_378571 [Nephila pilipes]
MHSHSPIKPKKFKGNFTNRKYLFTVLWKRKDVLFVEFMECGTTITADSQNKHRISQVKKITPEEASQVLR